MINKAPSNSRQTGDFTFLSVYQTESRNNTVHNAKSDKETAGPILSQSHEIFRMWLSKLILKFLTIETAAT